MLTVFIQVLKLLFFALVGFLLAKVKVLDPAHGGILSKLLVWVFLPCNIFKTFAKNCTVAYISENFLLIGISFASIWTKRLASVLAGTTIPTKPPITKLARDIV